MPRKTVNKVPETKTKKTTAPKKTKSKGAPIKAKVAGQETLIHRGNVPVKVITDKNEVKKIIAMASGEKHLFDPRGYFAKEIRKHKVKAILVTLLLALVAYSVMSMVFSFVNAIKMATTMPPMQIAETIACKDHPDDFNCQQNARLK